LSRVIGATVRERCERGSSPRCCFEVLPDAGVDRPSRASSAGQAAPFAPAGRDEDEPMGGDPPCWQHLFEDDEEVERATREHR
jgi:hypothetical protein